MKEEVGVQPPRVEVVEPRFALAEKVEDIILVCGWLQTLLDYVVIMQSI